jgi:hypothetical protein
MKKLVLGRKKLLLLGAVVLLIVSTVGCFLLYQRYAEGNRKKDLEQTKVAVSEALQKEGSCEQGNIDGLEKLYNGSDKQEDKALYAEQAAHCKLLSKQFDEAITWYKKAEVEYTALNNTDKVDYLKRSIENTNYIKSYQPDPGPTDPQEDRGDM